MTKGALLDELASAIGFKKLEISNALNNLAEIGTREVKKCGKFNLPGLCPITATPLSLTTIEAHRKVWELRQKLKLLSIGKNDSFRTRIPGSFEGGKCRISLSHGAARQF